MCATVFPDLWFRMWPGAQAPGRWAVFIFEQGRPDPMVCPPPSGRPSPLSSTHRARSLRGAWGNPKLAKVGLRGPLGESVTLENGIPETRGMLQSPATGPSTLSSRRCKAAVLAGISFACNRVSRSVVSNAARCAGAREMGGPCPTSDPRSLFFATNRGSLLLRKFGAPCGFESWVTLWVVVFILSGNKQHIMRF